MQPILESVNSHIFEIIDKNKLINENYTKPVKIFEIDLSNVIGSVNMAYLLAPIVNSIISY